MDITPPFGFTELVPLEKHHRIRRSTTLPAFYATQNAIPVTVGELPLAMRDLPVVFAPIGGAEAPTSFLPVAICGLGPSENLLVTNGQWDAQTYLPAYVRRHPFCIAVGPADHQQERPAVLCIEKSSLAEDGEPIVNEDGSPTPAWAQTQSFVNEVESDFVRTQQFGKLLHDLKILEGFTMTAPMPDGEELRVSGMYRISEDKLKALPADQLRMLIERGAMRLIYLHLASMDRFSLLVERRIGRNQPAAA